MTKLVLVIMVFSLVSLVACKNNKGGGSKQSIPAISEEGNHSDMIMLTKRDEQYANIKVDTARKKTIAEFTTILGTTRVDEKSIRVITARIHGRIDHLYARDPQQWISTGQPMYSIYSEELLTYENEFLTAIEQRSQFSDMPGVGEQLVLGARKKLLLWGMTEDQVRELKQTGKASADITFFSPASGTLIELPISEGQYVETGSVLFRIADLSQLWIEAQMYTNELKWLYEKPMITVEFDAYPGEVFEAKPVFDNPVIEEGQKISLTRLMILNSRRQLKPGMMAYVNIKRNEKKTLVIPKSSILIGEMTTAWVKTGDGMYESRMVELGIENKKEVEVVKGIREGEVVVNSGAFLLNSALILKKGAGMPGMEGMKM